MKSKIPFTEEQLEANDSTLKRLVEFTKSGEAILMVGAGCSADLYPAWQQFVDNLEQETRHVVSDFNEDKSNFLDFADKVKKILGDDRYYGLIYETFKPKDITHLAFHETLCRLPFRAITTTNYDLVLENALTAVTGSLSNSLHFEGNTKRKIHEFLQSLNFSSSPKRMIAHLHGIYDIEKSIILSGKEYSSKYGFELDNNTDTLFDQLKGTFISKEQLDELLIRYGYEWPLRRKLLWSLLATRRIVFIGFSMSDPYFIKMLDFVKDDLSTYNTETHFLILRITPSSAVRSLEYAALLKREYGIQTFFFQDEDNSYIGLKQFISELENQIGTLIMNNKKTVSISDEEILDNGDADLTERLFSISKKQQTNED
ncbi:SIR2 family protein [Chryseobacterium indologenes]|uniref:SIR2 family protein n=1 Tax=Chryseobacterium indologenes TaxID=253 RepID=UPI001623E681|nr:SIR2 family protein [Chryseobacterium indologenes]